VAAIQLLHRPVSEGALRCTAYETDVFHHAHLCCATRLSSFQSLVSQRDSSTSELILEGIAFNVYCLYPSLWKIK
jgi:hypothetical protein